MDSAASVYLRWRNVYGSIPRVVKELEDIGFPGDVESWVQRTICIKKKAERMPILSNMSSNVDSVLIDDIFPGRFHRYDSTILEALGWHLGILVERISDTEWHELL